MNTLGYFVLAVLSGILAVLSELIGQRLLVKINEHLPRRARRLLDVSVSAAQSAGVDRTALLAKSLLGFTRSLSRRDLAYMLHYDRFLDNSPRVAAYFAPTPSDIRGWNQDEVVELAEFFPGLLGAWNRFVALHLSLVTYAPRQDGTARSQSRGPSLHEMQLVVDDLTWRLRCILAAAVIASAGSPKAAEWAKVLERDKFVSTCPLYLDVDMEMHVMHLLWDPPK